MKRRSKWLLAAFRRKLRWVFCKHDWRAVSLNRFRCVICKREREIELWNSRWD